MDHLIQFKRAKLIIYRIYPILLQGKNLSFLIVLILGSNNQNQVTDQPRIA